VVRERCAANAITLFVLSLVINVGMWLERFVIVVGQSLHRDYLPSSWDMYYPTFLGLGHLYIGRSGCFSRCCSCSSACCR
jgi:hypothetical protein